MKKTLFHIKKSFVFLSKISKIFHNLQWDAAALSYLTILYFLPLLASLIWFLEKLGYLQSAWFYIEAWLMDQMQVPLPDWISEWFLGFFERSRELSQWGWLLLLAFFYSSWCFMNTLKRSLDRQLTHLPKASTKTFLFRSIFRILLPLLIPIVLTNAYTFVSYFESFMQSNFLIPWFSSHIEFLASFIVYTSFFAFYSSYQVSLKSSAIAGLTAAIALSIMKIAFQSIGIQLLTRQAPLLGSLQIFILAMIWIWWMWIVLLSCSKLLKPKLNPALKKPQLK